MPKAIYFDCFSGISGDMALGALLDAGLPLDALRAELGKLNIEGWNLGAERDMRRYLAGTRARVHAPEQPVHRHLADVRAVVERSALAPEVKQRSLRVFALLAEAEGKVHGIPAEQVHFHEVGALDAIVDVVGVVAGLALLEIDEIYASSLPLGSGWVRAAHGSLPVPAPAVLALLAAAGAPTLTDDTPGELVTPTGAAMLAALATFRRPAMRIQAVGYGLGSRDPERPNALRVWIGIAEDTERTDAAEFAQRVFHGVAGKSTTPAGSAVGSSPGASDEQNYNAVSPNASPEPAPVASEPDSAQSPPSPPSAILLETNIDDQPAEQLAYAAERLLELGALDAWLTPIQMKKGRLATLLAALVPAELEEAATALILRETTTLGVRRRAVERHVCERDTITVATPLGSVRVKRKRWHGEELGAAPEYEDCARLARQHGLPLREVYQLAMQEFKITS